MDDCHDQAFRYGSLFVRTDRGIREPADLTGRRTEIPGVAIDAAPPGESLDALDT